MKKTSESIVFFGSGPVAAASLALLAQDFAIEAVVTKPRAKHHRGDVPVLSLAAQLNIPVFTAGNKAELNQLFANSPVKSHLAILIDFGIIVSQEVIDYFPLGIINSHFSILPQWRGADPITFAILSGQKQTGVSLMLLVEKMDEGPLLAQSKYPLPPGVSARELTDALIEISHAALVEVLPKYIAGAVQPYPQDIETPATYSRKLTKADGVIDWHKPAEQIEREIRAFKEWPKSRTQLASKEVIITKARAEGNQEYGIRNTEEAFSTPDKQLAVQTGDGVLIIERLKPAGKREMSAHEFLAGNRL